MSLWPGVFHEVAIVLAPLVFYGFALSSRNEKRGGATAVEDENGLAHQVPCRDFCLVDATESKMHSTRQ